LFDLKKKITYKWTVVGFFINKEKTVNDNDDDDDDDNNDNDNDDDDDDGDDDEMMMMIAITKYLKNGDDDIDNNVISGSHAPCCTAYHPSGGSRIWP